MVTSACLRIHAGERRNSHNPHQGKILLQKDDVVKDAFYAELDDVYDKWPAQDAKSSSKILM